MSKIVVNTWRTFAEVLVKTNELDPTYPVIRHLMHNRQEDWKGRFMLHYIWFYNLGAAIRTASETDDVSFWDRVKRQANDKALHRGGARRHFRAENALKAIHNMRNIHEEPWVLIGSMHRTSYHEIYKNITTNFVGTQMGPYYIWKLMDLFNICMDKPIYLPFEDAVRYLPEVPCKAAATFFPDQPIRKTLQMITEFIGDLPHPVLDGTMCGPSEAETILCGLNASFGKGKLPIGADIDHQYEILKAYPSLQECLPQRISHLYELGRYINV